MLDAMCENLNTSVALAKALEGTRVILRESEGLSGASARSAKEFLDKTNNLLGIVRSDEPGCMGGSSAKGPEVDVARIEGLIAERAEAKKTKDFARADAIRNQLDDEGIELRDTPEGTTWKSKGLI